MRFNPDTVFDLITYDDHEVATMCGTYMAQVWRWRHADGVGDHLPGLCADAVDRLCINVLKLHPSQVYGEEWEMEICRGCGEKKHLNEFNSGTSRVCHACRTGNHVSEYMGVSWHKGTARWQAQIKVAGKHIHIGCYRDEKEAADAYNQAVLQYRGVPA